MARRAFDFLQLPNPLNFRKFFRQLEQEVETVINVLQPGPLGIIEHKFTATEIHEAKAIVDRAVKNWQQNTALEKCNPNMQREGIQTS